MILRQEKVVTVMNSSMNWNKGVPMLTYKVITLPLAEEDIADQTDYIAFELKSPEAAMNMVRGFRKTYYKNYKIYFLINEREQAVYILRVFHMLVDSRAKILKMFMEQK